MGNSHNPELVLRLFLMIVPMSVSLLVSWQLHGIISQLIQHALYDELHLTRYADKMLMRCTAAIIRETRAM